MSTDTNIEKHVEAEMMGIMPVSTGTLQASDTYKAVHQAQLEALAHIVEALPEITDAKTYDQNQRARTKLVEIRTGIDKRRKALFDPLKRLKAEVDAYLGTSKESGLQARIAAMESAIARKQQAWDEEQERKRQEAQKIIDDRNRARGQALMRLGYGFDGSSYVLRAPEMAQADIVSTADVNMMTEERWTLVLAECGKKAERVRVEFLEEQRTADLLAAGASQAPDTGHLEYRFMAGELWTWTVEELGGYDAADLKDEIEAVKADIKARAAAKEAEDRRVREEAEALRAEVAKLKAEKQATRHERLMGIGVQQAPEGFYFVPMGDTLTDRRWECVSDLAGLSDEDWQYAIGAAGRAVTDRKAELAAIQAEDAARADAGEFVEEEHPDETLVRETEEPLAKKRAARHEEDVVVTVVTSLAGKVIDQSTAIINDTTRMDAVLTTLLATRDEVSAFRSSMNGGNEALILAEVEDKVAAAVKLVREYLIQKGS